MYSRGRHFCFQEKIVVFFNTRKRANLGEKRYWLSRTKKYECNTSKRKKKHFFYDFWHVRRQNKETKILFMARSRLFLWKDFSWFFFHGEFHSQKKVFLFYILKQVLYWKFSKTRLLLVSNDFDHEGQKMFVCVDGLRLL